MLHADRDRAESFGGVAVEYDRVRPSYPDALIAFICGERKMRVLDVGCGTGKVARRLVEDGCTVWGLDVDERMAEVARHHGITVEVTSFEAWDPPGRTFDVVTAGQAWHWVDDQIGPRKAAEVLAPGGRLVVFWNYGHPKDPNIEAALERAYDQASPGSAVDTTVAGWWRNKGEVDEQRRAIDASGAFGSVELHTFPWEWRIPPSHWIALQATYSENVVMEKEKRHVLFEGFEQALAGVKGDLVLEYQTFCLAATRP